MTLTLRTIAFSTMLGLATQAAHAQEFPVRPVNIINPYPAGGTTDVLTRVLAQGMTTRLGQQFVVMNRPGAGGAVGTASVARAEPDGYNLLFAPALVLSVVPAVQKRSEVGYDATMLTPVCQTFVNTIAMVVRNDSPIKSIADLAKAARENPDKINYGHQGATTIPRLAVEELLEVGKFKLNGVAYRGEPAILTDLLGGQIEVGAVVLGAAGMSKEIRVIGTFGEERHHAFPDVPTATEQGFNVISASFGGVYAPAATPRPIIDKLSTACVSALQDPAYKSAAENAAQPRNYFDGRNGFAARLQRDIDTKKQWLVKLGVAAKE